MGLPAAKQGDQIVGTDLHWSAGSATPVTVPPQPLMPLPFSASLTQGLSPDVNIMSRPAATVGSGGTNAPTHPVAVVATNQGTVFKGSTSVFINKKPAARAGDAAMTCNDPAPLPTGNVVVPGACTVFIG